MVHRCIGNTHIPNIPTELTSVKEDAAPLLARMETFLTISPFPLSPPEKIVFVWADPFVAYGPQMY